MRELGSFFSASEKDTFSLYHIFRQPLFMGVTPIKFHVENIGLLFSRHAIMHISHQAMKPWRCINYFLIWKFSTMTSFTGKCLNHNSLLFTFRFFMGCWKFCIPDWRGLGQGWERTKYLGCFYSQERESV